MLHKHLPEALITKVCHARHAQYEIAVAQVGGEWYSLLSVNGSRPFGYPVGFLDAQNAQMAVMLDMDWHARLIGCDGVRHADWNWQDHEDPSGWIRSFD
jgi:hypothetical protein